MNQDIFISLKLTAVMAVPIIITNLIQFNSIVLFILKSLFLSVMWFGLFYFFVRMIKKFLPELYEIITKIDNKKVKGEHLDIRTEDDEKFFNKNEDPNEGKSFDKDSYIEDMGNDSIEAGKQFKETDNKIANIESNKFEKSIMKKRENPVLNQDDKTLAKAVRTMMKKE